MRRLLAVLLLVAGCGGGEPPAPETGAPAPGPKSPGAKTPAPETAKPQEASIETLAQALLDAAGRRPPEQALAAHHDVCVRFPMSKAGLKAAARCVELESEAVRAIDREFVEPRAAAETLKKKGRFADAIASLRSFSVSTPKEPLKRRAESLIEQIENEARKAYLEVVRAARKPATAGSYDEAAQILKSASEFSTAEVASAAERDLALLDRCRQVEVTKKSMAAEQAALGAFGERAAKLLKRVKERAYTEVIKDLDAAISDPALSACRERLTADRAAVVAASTFWDAIQKTLKARLNQEVHWRTGAEGKTVRGVLKKIHESGLSVRLEGAAADTPLDSIHSDQLLTLGINRDGLPEDAGASYAAAAMWFFLEGRAVESKIELATASEMGADVALTESAWRRGFFRLALGK